MSRLALNRTIRKYYREQCLGPDARGRSWDYCYRFFREHWRDLPREETQDAAALHLAFYLASWGMYRPSSFLLQRAYTVHRAVVSVLASSRFSELWERDNIGADSADIALAGTIMELVEAVKAEYRKVDAEYKELTGTKPQKSMDLLVTKALLGTVGCLPARDTYFEKGFKAHFKPLEIPYGALNEAFTENILQFCVEQKRKLAELQLEIVDVDDVPYPVMKLVDMYFWQRGSMTPEAGRRCSP